MKPVYIINGFLESGKTEFITYTLQQPYFQIKGKTLLLLCEEGEIEYDEKILKKSHIEKILITEEASVDQASLLELDKKYHPERIIIEYNGMWNFKNFKLPQHWGLEQQITCVDASTFPMYYTNMKSLLAEIVRNSEMIIFNRCDGVADLNVYKRNIKAVNQKAEVIFEDSNGEISEIFEEDLPYDLKSDPIVLTEESYGIWYLDSMDHLERYENKKVQFLAQTAKPAHFPENYFVPGRMAMTCCAEDMTFLGYACEFDQAKDLKSKEWVCVTAIVKKEFWKDYEGEGPVLHAVSVEKAKAPKSEAISFS